MALTIPENLTEIIAIETDNMQIKQKHIALAEIPTENSDGFRLKTAMPIDPWHYSSFLPLRFLNCVTNISRDQSYHVIAYFTDEDSAVRYATIEAKLRESRLEYQMKQESEKAEAIKAFLPHIRNGELDRNIVVVTDTDADDR